MPNLDMRSSILKLVNNDLARKASPPITIIEDPWADNKWDVIEGGKDNVGDEQVA